MNSDTGTQFAYLTDIERVLAAADVHMAVCDAPTVFECPECDRKLTKYRKYLRVLADAGLLVRAGHSETRPPLPLDMGTDPCETPMPGRPDLHCDRPLFHAHHGAHGTDGTRTLWVDTYTPTVDQPRGSECNVVTASQILRERAMEARAALADCAANAPWDSEYCERAITENEALADLLEALDPIPRDLAWEREPDLWELIVHIGLARDAFEAAITEGQQP